MEPTDLDLDRVIVDLEKVANDLVEAAHIDDVFWQVQAIIRDNPAINKGDAFQQWIASTYVDSISSRLRRLIDRRKNSISLWRILESLKALSTSLTRERYIEICAGPAQRLADGWFNSIAGKDADHVCRARIIEKQRLLVDVTSVIKQYTDTHVAHHSRVLSEPPTFVQVRESLVGVFQVFHWCSALLKSANWISPVPSILPNWTAVFREPWLRPELPVPEYVHLDELIREKY